MKENQEKMSLNLLQYKTEKNGEGKPVVEVVCWSKVKELVSSRKRV